MIELGIVLLKRNEKGSVSIRSSLTGKHLAEINVQNSLPEFVHYYPKEARFVLWYDSIVEIRNSVTGAKITSFGKTYWYNEVEFSPSGADLILLTGNGYELRSAFTGKKLYSKEYENPNYLYGTWAYAGKEFVCFVSRNTLSAVNLKNENKITEFNGHTGIVHSIRFNKNEKYMVTASYR